MASNQVRVEVEIRTDNCDSRYFKFPDGAPDRLDYEALFFPDGTGSKKSMHRGPTFGIVVNGAARYDYEIVIDDSGVPKFIRTDVNPVVPAFAAEKSKP